MVRQLNKSLFLFPLLLSVIGCTGEQQSAKNGDNGNDLDPQKKSLPNGPVAKPPKSIDVPNGAIEKFQPNFGGSAKVTRGVETSDLQRLKHAIMQVEEDIDDHRNEIKQLTREIAKHEVECESLSKVIRTKSEASEKTKLQLKLLRDHLTKNPEQNFVGPDNKEYSSDQIKMVVTKSLKQHKSDQDFLNQKKQHLQSAKNYVKVVKERLERHNVEIELLKTKRAALSAQRMSGK